MLGKVKNHYLGGNNSFRKLVLKMCFLGSLLVAGPAGEGAQPHFHWGSSTVGSAHFTHQGYLSVSVLSNIVICCLRANNAALYMHKIHQAPVKNADFESGKLREWLGIWVCTEEHPFQSTLRSASVSAPISCGGSWVLPSHPQNTATSELWLKSSRFNPFSFLYHLKPYILENSSN